MRGSCESVGVTEGVEPALEFGESGGVVGEVGQGLGVGGELAKAFEVDADAVHRAKVAYFREFAREGLEPRAGVLDVVKRAKAQGVKLGLATTTGSDTVDLIFEGLGDVLPRDMFGFVGDGDLVSRGKPSPEIYRLALSHFGISASQAVAIEDTPESAAAPIAAGIPTLAFPGDAARGRSFPVEITHNVDRLEPSFCGLGLAAA